MLMQPSTHTYITMHVCMYEYYIYTSIHIHIHIYIHIHIHIYTYTHIHMLFNLCYTGVVVAICVIADDQYTKFSLSKVYDTYIHTQI